MIDFFRHPAACGRRERRDSEVVGCKRERRRKGRNRRETEEGCGYEKWNGVFCASMTPHHSTPLHTITPHHFTPHHFTPHSSHFRCSFCLSPAPPSLLLSLLPSFHPSQVSGDGQLVYAGTEYGHLHIIDTRTHNTLQQLHIPTMVAEYNSDWDQGKSPAASMDWDKGKSPAPSEPNVFPSLALYCHSSNIRDNNSNNSNNKVTVMSPSFFVRPSSSHSRPSPSPSPSNPSSYSQFVLHGNINNSMHNSNNARDNSRACVSLCVNGEKEGEVGYQLKDSSFGCLNVVSKDVIFHKNATMPRDGISLLVLPSLPL